MSFKIISLNRFQKDVKNLQKRFPKIKDDLKEVVSNLYLNPTLGIPLGNNIFKLRLANSSVPVGKSGGFRVITYYKSDIAFISCYNLFKK